ncbi:MAG: Fic family protein [Candidatus Omnitrophica bacterium]|nr:Fic family protein [Candidatus Omnitrophota bacterium]
MQIGRYISQPTGYKAFVPDKFPPVESFPLPQKTEVLHAKAAFLLGKLDGITQLLPDLDFFIFMYVRKEAALSSEIEGTKATLIDAISAEAEIKKAMPDDVDRILHYIEAMNFGLKRLEKLPLSLRLIKEVHKTLIEGTGDAPGKTPGEFRRSQNWIGGGSPNTARFVPPPVHELSRAMSDFEKFLYLQDTLPPLIKTALMHAQFETIHPFLDGNGRTGRLLITFYLCQSNILDRPVLYLSEYFKRYRDAYFDLMHAYHDKGEVIPWINFFLEGVAQVAEAAIDTSKKINALREEDVEKIHSLGRTTKVALNTLKRLYELPIINVKKIEEWTGLSRPAANALVQKLIELKILSQRDPEIKYDRVFEYRRYLKNFSK